MKKLKIFFTFIVLVLIIATSAIKKVPIDEKVSSIESKDDFVKLNDISKDFTNAILAIEDHRFYEHGPIDLISIFRAIAKDIKELKLVEGGSTITQQLAKNMYFTQEKKFTRKIAEIFVAYDLERLYDKDEILELYINTLYFGDGHYGIKEASVGYFDKLPDKLNFEEATMLAGIPNAPSIYALGNNSQLSYQRQQQVIDAMVKFEYITQEDLNFKVNTEQ